MKVLSLLRVLLPYRRTTEAKAREAIIRCGISPDAIAWQVGPDGSFAFGRKSPETTAQHLKRSIVSLHGHGENTSD